MSAIIEIDTLTKRYGGRAAVRELSLEVQQGDIFGFVGPNGAGKTSTIRVMTTLLHPTSGDIRVGGHSVTKDPQQVRSLIGYMPDFFGVYNDMMTWEYLDFFGACYEIPQETRHNLVDDLLELVDLKHRRNDPVEKLSRGMKQRLSLARTLVHDPQVLILDEPASGLDPRARAEIRALLLELSRLGKTIFFSTHILADVAEICTRVGILEAGELAAYGTPEELQQQIMPTRKVQITVLEKLTQAMNILVNMPGVTLSSEQEKATDKQNKVELDFSGTDEELSTLLAKLVEGGVPVLQFTEDSRDMESVFLRATQGLVT